MPDEYNAQLAKERHERVMELLEEIRTEAKATNGRVNGHETRISVLEDRSPSKHGAGWGAVGGAVSGFLAGLLK
jgi:hypothetical protein